MTHDEIQDLLEAYVDETLDRPTRAEVDRHLAECAECRAILEGVPAVRLGNIDAPAFDERAMRRAVRTTLWRLAINVVLVTLVGWLVLTLVGALLVQPFVTNRGGRAAAATLATQDLAVMYNPGVALSDSIHDYGIIRRTSRATVVRPIGTEIVEVGTLSTRIGPVGFDSTEGFGVNPLLGNSGGVVTGEQLAEVGSGTVTTVDLIFDPPISTARAQQLADSPIDVRVVWAGFPVGDGDVWGIGLERNGTVGYSTCDSRSVDAELLGAASAARSQSTFTETPSIDRALAATRDAVANLLAHDELIESISPPVATDDVRAASLYLAGDPGVRMLVVTGPTVEVLRFIDDAAPSTISVRGIEFTNWFQPLCGR